MRLSLLAFVTAALPLCGAEPPHPANVASEPGRLVGWGKFGTTAVESTLPQGLAAEGFVEVCTGWKGWIARKEDGSVLVGGEDAWLRASMPQLEQPARQVAMEANDWLILLENGTVRSGGPTAPPVPQGLNDVVWVGAGLTAFAALRKTGELKIWGASERIPPDYGDRFAEITRSVRLAAVGRTHVVFQTTAGEVYRISLFSPAKEQRLESLRNVQQLAAGWYQTLGLTAEGALISSGGEKENMGFSGVAPPEATDLVRIGGMENLSLAQRRDGTWLVWGRTPNGAIDPGKLRNWMAMSPPGRDAVLGIARSALAKPVLERPVPEAEAILVRLSAAEEKAGAELDAWKTRYFDALDRILASSAAPALRAAIEQEKQEAENLERAPFSQESLARYQAAFRERLPGLLASRHQAKRKAIDEAASALRTLQDQLTRDQRLQDAVAVRALSQSLVERKALLAAAESASGAESKASARRFPEIPPAERIFTIQDPAMTGELVIIGVDRGKALEVPRSINRRRIAAVHGNWHSWVVIEEGGNFYCGSHNSRLAQPDVSRSVRKLDRVLHGSTLLGYLARTTRSETVAWGWYSNLDPPKYPDALQEKPLREVRTRATEQNQLLRLLALREDGTVLVGGELYEAGQAPWVLPNNLGKCRGILRGKEFDGVLRNDGTVVVWGNEPPKIPPDFTDLLKFRNSSGLGLGLRADGTLSGLKLQGVKQVLLEVPVGLDQVVDIAVHADLALALRADGTWVGWGTNPDGILDQLDQLQGCRHIAIGGDAANRFVLGIRPEK